jgi:NAD(P)-dependent dehydrogenase (short-subunit alcohol dehydrogenase family)
MPSSTHGVDERIAWITGSSRGLGRVIAPNCAAPGSTPAARSFVNEYDFDRSNMDAEETPVRDGNPEEMARPAVFLLSGDATFVSDQAIRVDRASQGWSA